MNIPYDVIRSARELGHLPSEEIYFSPDGRYYAEEIGRVATRHLFDLVSYRVENGHVVAWSEDPDKQLQNEIDALRVKGEEAYEEARKSQLTNRNGLLAEGPVNTKEYENDATRRLNGVLMAQFILHSARDNNNSLTMRDTMSNAFLHSVLFNLAKGVNVIDGLIHKSYDLPDSMPRPDLSSAKDEWSALLGVLFTYGDQRVGSRADTVKEMRHILAVSLLADRAMGSGNPEEYFKKVLKYRPSKDHKKYIKAIGGKDRVAGLIEDARTEIENVIKVDLSSDLRNTEIETLKKLGDGGIVHAKNLHYLLELDDNKSHLGSFKRNEGVYREQVQKINEEYASSRIERQVEKSGITREYYRRYIAACDDFEQSVGLPVKDVMDRFSGMRVPLVARGSEELGVEIRIYPIITSVEFELQNGLKHTLDLHHNISYEDAIERRLDDMRGFPLGYSIPMIDGKPLKWKKYLEEYLPGNINTIDYKLDQAIKDAIHHNRLLSEDELKRYRKYLDRHTKKIGRVEGLWVNSSAKEVFARDRRRLDNKEARLALLKALERPYVAQFSA